MLRATVLVFVLIVIIGGAVLLFRRPPPGPEGHLTAEHVVLTGHRDDGSRAWSIQAKTGSLNGDTGILETVELTFFDGSDADIVVRGDRMSRNSGGSTVSGSTQIEQGDAMSLETDTIFWDERNDVLESGPVSIEMDSASVEAGAFHHDLEAALTTLTRGVEARLTQDDVEFIARSDSAEATSDQLALMGNVVIQTEDGDEYHCERAESDISGSSFQLIGEVSGTWQNNAFSANNVQLDAAGIQLRGNVTIDLELLMMDEPNDA